MIRIVISLFCLLLLPMSAIALEVTPMGGYRFGGQAEAVTGETLKFNETGSFALALDFDYQRNKQIELFWSHQQTTLTSSSGIKVFDSGIDYIHIGGTVLFPNENFIPYAVGGLGVTHFSPDNGYNSETRFSLSFGGGAKFFLLDRVGLRLEGRGYATLFPNEGYAFCGDGGCNIAISSDVLFQFEGLAGVILLF